MAATKAWAGILPVTLLLAACQATDGVNVFDKPLDFLGTQAQKINMLGGTTLLCLRSPKNPNRKLWQIF